MSQVAVSVLSGADLTELTGQPYIAPYVEIEYGKAKRTTNTASPDVDPEWNERFVFNMDEEEDEMSFTVMNAGDVFIGRAVLSFSRFGTDADLCFELANQDNVVAGKLIVKIEPVEEQTEPTEPAEPTELLEAPAVVEDVVEVVAEPAPAPKSGTRLRVAILQAEVPGAGTLSAAITVGSTVKVTDTEGMDELMFQIEASDTMIISLQNTTYVLGTATLKGETVLSRLGTEFWLALAAANGPHSGKVLVSLVPYVPKQNPVSATLDDKGEAATALMIEVMSAEGLVRKCNPCLYLSINDTDKATTIKEDTDSPVWNESFEFFVTEEDTLSAAIFEAEDFIAEAIVPVAELLYVASIGQQLEVKLLDRRRKAAGLLLLGSQITKSDKTFSLAPDGHLAVAPREAAIQPTPAISTGYVHPYVGAAGYSTAPLATGNYPPAYRTAATRTQFHGPASSVYQPAIRTPFHGAAPRVYQPATSRSSYPAYPASASQEYYDTPSLHSAPRAAPNYGIPYKEYDGLGASAYSGAPTTTYGGASTYSRAPVTSYRGGYSSHLPRASAPVSQVRSSGPRTMAA